MLFMTWARILADVTVLVHAAFVAFVVLGLVLVLVGISLDWRWTRNPIFRVAHLAAIGLVVFESLAGIPCPLTIWENHLRALAGQASYPGDFVGYWAHRLIFARGEPWVFTVIYVLFGVAAVLVFWLVPPVRRRDVVERRG
jgi:hypothetical protein